MSQSAATSGPHDRQWFIAGRWQEFQGEARANLLRIVGVGAFYVVELVNYYGLHLGPLEMPAIVELPFHQTITALAVVWSLLSLGVLFCLAHRIFPAGLKYVSTGCDLVLLSCTLLVADGPRSPLVVGFFLLVALSALRFSLSLVWFATAGAAAGYVVLLGYAKWFTERDLRVPRHNQVIFLLALILTGVVVGQVIRRVRRLAEEYAARVQAAGEPGP